MSIFFMDVNWTGVLSSRHVRDTKDGRASLAGAALQVMSWQLETQMLESCT